MDRIKRGIINSYPVNPVLYESIREFVLRKGKRIRPLLLVLSYKGYSSPGKKYPASLYRASTCIELPHNFMLIHDDIIDRSNLLREASQRSTACWAGSSRRTSGRTSKHDLGIIAGDIVYALAIDAFWPLTRRRSASERAPKYLIQTAAFTAMGGIHRHAPRRAKSQPSQRKRRLP